MLSFLCLGLGLRVSCSLYGDKNLDEYDLSDSFIDDAATENNGEDSQQDDDDDDFEDVGMDVDASSEDEAQKKKRILPNKLKNKKKYVRTYDVARTALTLIGSRLADTDDDSDETPIVKKAKGKKVFKRA